MSHRRNLSTTQMLHKSYIQSKMQQHNQNATAWCNGQIMTNNQSKLQQEKQLLNCTKLLHTSLRNVKWPASCRWVCETNNLSPAETRQPVMQVHTVHSVMSGAQDASSFMQSLCRNQMHLPISIYLNISLSNSVDSLASLKAVI